RGDDRKRSRRVLFQEKFEIGGQAHALLAQCGNSDLVENLERRAQCRHRQNRRIPELPSLRTLNRMKIRSHLKPGWLVVSTPAGEPRQTKFARVAFVDEASANAAGATVHVFVGTPHSEITTRVV